MSRNSLKGLAGALLATAIAVVAALLLAHWAACEQSDRVCMITGEDSK